MPRAWNKSAAMTTSNVHFKISFINIPYGAFLTPISLLYLHQVENITTLRIAQRFGFTCVYLFNSARSHLSKIDGGSLNSYVPGKYQGGNHVTTFNINGIDLVWKDIQQGAIEHG